MKTETFPVEGLMCANCAKHTENALKNVEGVENAVCNFEKLEAVEKEGYKLVVK